MCFNVTTVNGYGVNLSNIIKWLHPRKILLSYLIESSINFLEKSDWLTKFWRAPHHVQIEMLNRLEIAGKEGIFSFIAGKNLSSGVISTSFDTDGLLLHLPEFPWHRSLIDRHESALVLFEALQPFLAQELTLDEFQGVISYIEDAGDLMDDVYE